MAVRKGFELNLELVKTVFEWTVKLSTAGFIIAQIFLQFYLQQDRAQDRGKRDDTQIQSLENRLNEMNRELVQRKIDNAVLQKEVEDQEKYYLLTRH